MAMPYLPPAYWAIWNAKMTADIHAKTLRRRAGENLLSWLESNAYQEFPSSDEYEDTDERHTRAAFAAGYNECRAEAMRAVADLVFEELDEGTDESAVSGEDEEEEEEDGCDCGY